MPRRSKTQPLLTREQLLDWLIYHRPLEDSLDDLFPFRVRYKTMLYMGTFSCRASTPLGAYEELATSLMRDRSIHREITRLYWYWTL